MIICPYCNKPNSDNIKCFYCGADLTTMNANLDKILQDGASISKDSKNSTKISNMALAIFIIGIILAIVLGFVFQIATIKTGLYSTETTYSFNWNLCVSVIIGAVCFAVLLKAMSYIAKAIEEK